MAQLSIDTLNKTDRDNAMVALYNIALYNGEDPLFCTANQYNDLGGKYKQLSVEYQKNKEELDLYKDEYKKQADRIKELFEANNNLREENGKMTAEIKELKEKLRGFIPGYGEENKLIYYKPEEGRLETTTIISNALFVGVSKGENVFEYQFNKEKGPHVKAIQSQNESLVPFCDIKYNAVDGNCVENIKNGTFSLVNGEFKIIEKAEISIIKNS